MQTRVIIGFIGFFLLAGSIFPALGQSLTIADNVVINEIDINPPGDDSKSVTEWIEIYNPTDKSVDIGGWEIASTTVLKKTMKIPVGTIIQPNKFLTYSYQSVWFTDVSEIVQLRNSDGVVIDQTPSISDLKDDFSSWQRIYDGVDTDSSSDWKFSFSNAGSSNGKLTTTITTDKTSVTISTDKSNYAFQETAQISGEVSKQLFVEKPFFQATPILIKIYGPNGFEKNLSLFPDLKLKYQTNLSLQKVLGITQGIYYVVVDYGGAIASTQFEVDDKLVSIGESESSQLTISTDKESYIPGETATIIANTNNIVPLAGLKFKVTDPAGKQVFDGALYPDKNGKFSTTLYMNTVQPVYGFYKIVADYSKYSTVSSFELIKDAKENKIISLTTDKKAYGLGDTVIISGRLNNLWIFSLDLEILQTGFGALQQDALNRLKIQDSVKLAGDSTFKYEFKIPNNSIRYGDYRVTVSKDVGTESVVFHVVENPSEFVESSLPFTVLTDKSIYDLGDPIIISGKVNNPKISSTYQTPVVEIVIKNSEGGQTSYSVFKPSGSKSKTFDYSLTAVPDQVGNYKVQDTVHSSKYDPGTYSIKASYGNGLLTSSTTFTVIDPLNIEFPIITLDKDVYGLGEEVHLTAIVPRVGASKPDISIILTKPDGTTNTFGTTAENGKFSWTWKTPLSEKINVVQNERTKFSSNYGVYKLSISQSNTAPVVVFFKVSPNPESDILNIEPLTVTSEFPVYNVAQNQKLTILGTAIKRIQGTQGLVVPDRVDLVIKSSSNKIISESSVNLDAGGNFKGSFDMPVTVFKEGNYKITAIYQGIRAENFFQVDNDFIFGGDEVLSLLIATDKEEYSPGDTARITARPSKMIFLETIEIGIPTEEQTKLNCGSFVCGPGVATKTLRQDPTGTFAHTYTFPANAKLGTYIVTFNTEFGTFSKSIKLVEKIPEPETIPESKISGDRVIEKVNRITDSKIEISVNKKIINEKEMSPRSIQGSLFTISKGDESNVNLKVSTSDGTCVIGQDSDCMIQNSTRVPGAIFKVIKIGDIDYNVRYSGHDVMLEKFTILPLIQDTPIPDSTWDVEVVKGDQISRLYYQITYVNLE
ncbi:MAG TPA: lamin tail domain-containing protein [Nitrosopumilaceae archaeon]|nr:lamin tail domain-containing protein [Nitrosopumilaceae archaeon]